MRLLSVASLALLATGCVSNPYASTVTAYNAAYPSVALGMSLSEVSGIMEPTQSLLAEHEVKQPDKYIKEGTEVDILYYRSGWQEDGLTTDDEYTPYLFNDGELVAIGWATLGGPKSTGQARDVNIQQQAQTIVVY